MAQRWYVLQTKKGMEEIAIENIEDQGFKVFNPCYRELVCKANHKFYQSFQLYSGYIFVKFDIVRQNWRPLSFTNGVRQIISATDHYVHPLPRGFVEELRNKTREGFIVFETAVEIVRRFIPGEVVKVQNGSFRGLTGICEKHNKNNVLVVLSLLGRKVMTSLPSSALSPMAQTTGDAVAS